MKFKRLAAVSLAAAMAITSSIVCQIGASAAETELSTTSISVTDLEKYDSLKVTYAPQLVGDCGHSHDAGLTNCPWAQVAFIATEVDGIAADISDSKKSTWYQPDTTKTAATNEDAAECTATVKVADILASFTSDKDWSSDYTLKTISLQGWQCSVTKVIGVSADSTGTPSTDEGESSATSDYALLYDKEFVVSDKYEGEQIDVKAAAGDKITVTYKLNDSGDYHQLSFKHAGEGWPALESPAYTNEWKCVDVSQEGTFSFTLTADDAANITANKLVISGYAVTYTKVELNADKKPADETSDYDTQQSEQVKDYGTDTTKELHVMSITAKDAAKYSGYKITVTLSNNKTLTKTTTDCYKSFKYTNSKGDSTTETSADNYFIIVRIINIPDGVTVSSVTFTPVE